ncbi:hypothetical protein DOTSEDRAFT_24456 [Dothistroma septosporum NZE10]|uniref:Zn(2)-C6 fungal-type domain-containing protein n=1 Tax=Dothistroma septosporum (strain NZE10 / CBS 128990) TaxID=675120 RepID=N1PPV4_DOTSN|nr:hypothetical protein DOTSEDRAFT_24456 [Dothistroma septosporum NZE10]
MFGGADDKPDGNVIIDVDSPKADNQQHAAVSSSKPADAPSFTPANAPPVTAAALSTSSGYTTARNHFRRLRACQGCAKSKMGCDGQAPCTRCQQRRIPCIQQLPKAVRRRQHVEEAEAAPTADTQSSQPQPQAQPHAPSQPQHQSQQLWTHQPTSDPTKTVLTVASSSEQNTSLTTRDVELLLKAYRCMRQEISVDYAKLAKLAQLKDSDSAKASWHNLKKKIDGVGKRAVVVKAVTARRSIAQRPQQDPEVSQPSTPSMAPSLAQQEVPEADMGGAN